MTNDVCNALSELGHKAEPVAIYDDPMKFIASLVDFGPDLAFNLVESVYNNSAYEMNIPGLLELLKIPYTGSPSIALGLCVEKGKAKELLASRGIPTPGFFTARSTSDLGKLNIDFPLFVKPLHEDGSLGISADSVVSDRDGLYEIVEKLSARYGSVLIEKYIDGRELNVSILGNNPPKVLPVSEIDYSQMPSGSPKVLTYNAKWINHSEEYIGSKPLCPACISDKTKLLLERYVLDVFELFSLKDYGRVDFRMDKSGNVYVIDINPNPCISVESGFIRSAGVAGYSFTETIGKIIDSSMEKSDIFVGNEVNTQN
ncbi:D-alanine--D-alanine ligase [Candidatus Auribacterota bacterium]